LRTLSVLLERIEEIRMDAFFLDLFRNSKFHLVVSQHPTAIVVGEVVRVLFGRLKKMMKILDGIYTSLSS
jgi:hypothetical protein